LGPFVREAGADESMLLSSIFDHQKRLRSFEMAAKAGAQLE